MLKIPVARPLLGEEEALAAREAILSGWVTQGPRVKKFEENFATLTGAAHSCAVSNCTTALHLSLLALGVQPGDTVITVSHSFIATANSIRSCQAEPVFVDIDPETFNMDPIDLERVLTQDFERRDGALWYKDMERLTVGESPLCGRKGPLGRLGAILVVHQAGMPADLSRIIAIASEAGVPLLEDAACATGSKISLDHGVNWSWIGKPHGQAACFSFHPRKVITTGDGGMITTQDEKLDHFVRLRRQHGMSISDLNRHAATEVVFEEYETTSFNYRMTDIQAAVGIEQLKRLEGLVASRRKIAAHYAHAFQGLEGLRTPPEPSYARTNWQSYIVTLAKPEWQRPVMQYLQDQGVSTRRGIMCSHLEQPYRQAWSGQGLEKSTRARDTGVILPLYPEMSSEQIDQVTKLVKKAVEKQK